MVLFHRSVPDARIKFAVIIARMDGAWLLCKHVGRDTYECPGGHREPGESAVQTARRELWEETGAVEYELTKLGVYSVCAGCEASASAEPERACGWCSSAGCADCTRASYGMLYTAAVHKLDELPPLEIECVEAHAALPGSWTYPDIQPRLLEFAARIDR